MFKKRSKVLFVGNVLGSLYAIYLMSYFFGAVGATQDSAEMIGAGIATVLVTPHIILILLSVMFGFLGFFLRKDGFNLTSAILYCVATIVFLMYIMFTAPLIVLGFVGYSKQKKMNKVSQDVIVE